MQEEALDHIHSTWFGRDHAPVVRHCDDSDQKAGRESRT